VRQFSQNGKVDSIEKLKARILWLTQCDTSGKLKIENITPISSVAGATDPLILLLAKIANLLSSDTNNLLNTKTVKFFFKKKIQSLLHSDLFLNNYSGYFQTGQINWITT
jgi:hypothetical protein